LCLSIHKLSYAGRSVGGWEHFLPHDRLAPGAWSQSALKWHGNWSGCLAGLASTDSGTKNILIFPADDKADRFYYRVEHWNDTF
jgi:hypothetical protein